jgi:hypothetical protein
VKATFVRFNTMSKSKDTCVLTMETPTEMWEQLKQNASDMYEIVGNSVAHGAGKALETTVAAYEATGDYRVARILGKEI